MWVPVAAWLGGLGIVAVALLSPLETLADELFAGHMVQHELLVFVAPPLFLAGVGPFFRVHGRGHRAVARLLRRVRPLAHPVVALVGSTAVLWLWHLPAAYDLALARDPVHGLEHLSFLGAFLAFWRPLMRAGGPLPVLRTAAGRAWYLIAGGAQSALLGAVLAFADRVYYSAYAATPGVWRLTPLADQQLGGMIMLLSGAIVCVVAAGLTIHDA